MKKYPIGFITKDEKDDENRCVETECPKVCTPRKSVVQVYFPHRGTGWAYYNDKFDLKVGDIVYVDGKLEGYRGRVTEVNYSFKIKLSDYKRVIAVADTDVRGDFYNAGSHLITFDKNAISYSKVRTWFTAPENATEYVSGCDDTKTFHIDDLSKMNLSRSVEEKGFDYYVENRVEYIAVEGICGYAFVSGSENYEVEFTYADGEIGNLSCSCFCGGYCKHEFAAMLQLRDLLDTVREEYEGEFSGCFAAVSRDVFVNVAMNNGGFKKVSLGM